MRAIAIIAAYNEERFIANCLEHLARQGLEIYLIDNESTDQTVAIAERYLHRGLIAIERFPRNGEFPQRLLHERKEVLAATLDGDWLMHADADEIHVPPPSGQTLAEAFAEVEAKGFNAINFQEFTFTPTQEAPDHDHENYLETMRWYYPFSPRMPHRLNAWKRQPVRVDLASSGGHVVRFPGLRMAPTAFIMRHYLFLSVDHARRKYVLRKWLAEELARGWHRERAALRPEMIRLSQQAELLYYRSDDQLDASNPRIAHPLFSTLPESTRP